MALLLGVGVYAVWLFGSLGSAVNQVLEENYKNIKAIHQMRLATARINIIYSLRAAPEVLQDKTSFFTNRLILTQSLRTLESSRFASQQREALNGLENAVNNYLALFDAFFRDPLNKDDAASQEARLRVPDATLLIAELGENLLHTNEQAMLDADQRARKKASDSIHFMLVAMGLAAIIFMYASYRLGKSLLEPIRLLTDFAGRIGAGDLDITAPVISEDELGKLASTFNNMAGKLRAYRQTTTERIFNLHHTIEATLAAFPDPIFVLDRDRRITLRNPAAARFAEQFGFASQLPPELDEKAAHAISREADYLPSSFKEALYYRVADQEKSFLPRVLIMRGQDRTLQGVAIVIQDVTRFRLLDDVKTNLVSTVSHELRTPLTSIRMALHILAERKIGELTSKQADLIGVARDDSERLLRTLNDLLDLSRLEGGTQNLHLDGVRPGDVVREVAAEASEAASRRDIALDVEAGEDLPELRLDRPRMKHVLTHFLDNALKHSSAGTRILLRACVQGDDAIRFSVIDHGEGIPSQFHARIFDRFFRVPGRPKTGAGIGLSISRQIVEAHHGHVGVVSSAEGGSEFYCDLPVDRADGAALS
jgi:signal transduction histidine kinase/HAMP domain-containing protein